MALGYDGTTFILAFDHRGSFKKKFGVTGDATEEQQAKLRDAKMLVWEGFLSALDQGASPDETGVLVDEEMGADVARAAKARGIRFAMPVEKSGQKLFDFEYGTEFGTHIEAFDPTFSKVLVRWNPGDDPAGNRKQGARLKQLADWLHEHGRLFLFEMLVPATDDDLAKVDGDVGRYDRELRPDLTLRAIEEVHAAGIEPDIWKIEGLDDRKDCERLAEAIRSDGRNGVMAVVLGRGADDDAVDHWLRQGAPVDGYHGFAIGRSIWTAGVEGYVSGDLGREEAARQIGANYVRFIDVYRSART